MERRLIATDIDGTLLQNGETAIREEFFRQAGRLLDAGVLLCAASGRQYSSLRRLFAPIADEIYYICENGAVVFGGGKLLGKSVFPREPALELCRDILALPDSELLISGANMSYLCTDSQEYIRSIRYFVGNNTTLLDTPEAMPEDFVKISAYCRGGAAAAEPQMAPKWAGRVQMAVAGERWLDFTCCDKGDGLRTLCRALGLSPEQVIAFGDNYNDIPMLDLAGTPWLMASAAEPLRRRYPNQCRRVEEVLAEL